MNQPLVTFALFCYRQEAFVRDAVQSALAQDYTPIEFILTDDASDDATFDIMRAEAERYDGPNRIVLNRNDVNLGALEHQNRIMERISGDYLILGHGDDVYLPARTRRTVETWQRTGAHAVASNVYRMDEAGTVTGTAQPADLDPDLSLERFTRAGGNAVCYGASLAWHRAVFDRFGPIDAHRSPHSGDHLIPFRALLLGGNAYIPEPLVYHRIHARANTFRVVNPATPALYRESYAAHNLTQHLYLLETLARFRKSRAHDPELGRAERNLIALIAGSALGWTGRRNALILDGTASAWTPE